MTRMGVVAAVFVATLFARGVVAAEVAPVCSDWDVVATPNSGKESDLRSVDAFDASNVWAIGHSGAADMKDGAPLAIRWDGSAWAVEPLLDLTHLGTQPTLAAVGIAPTGDPWVVGHLSDASSGVNVPLILRWSNGFWEAHHVAMVDSFAPRYPLLRDVDAIAENDAWTVGEAGTRFKGAIEPFAAHWDGLAWSEVVMPGTAASNRILTAVSAAAPNAVWAVGHDVDPLKNTSYARIYRWEGSAWSVVDHPAATEPGSALYDVVALTPDDIWAVGAIGTDRGLFLHWDGSSWTSYPAPANANPRSVDGAASNDVWAAGAQGNYHWDGTSWSFLPATNKPDTGAHRALAVAGPCDVWSISSWSDGVGSASLVERLGPSASAPEPPATPIAFVATPKTSKEIVLEWLPGGDPTGAAGQTAFVIERCIGEAGACKTFTVIDKVDGTVTTFADSDLKPATYYTYRVYAVNGAGTSEPTEPATALTFAEDAPSPLPEPDTKSTNFCPTPPPMPIALAARPKSSEHIVIEWLPGGGDKAVAVGQTAFVIERCIGEAGACPTQFTVIDKVGGTVTSFVDSGLKPATYYTYRVYAVNDAGTSEPTAPATALTFAEDGSKP